MDQDAFRQLLQSSNNAAPSSSNNPQTTRGSLLPSKQQVKTTTEPAFKPRKVKKTTDKYRNRAAERRAGDANDFAQVEAVLEDFERRNANEVDIEDKRRYLGGDSEHSVLVKGLDVSLLQQNKARAALLTEDDDSLEQAFQQTSSSTPSATTNTNTKKRTREDVIREIKEKRMAASDPVSAEGGDKKLEELRMAGKFKPIGFKPIGEKQSDADKEKKKKKKKRKAVQGKEEIGKQDITSSVAEETKLPPAQELPVKKAPVIEEEENVQADLDIFAGVGNYDGLGDENSDDDDEPLGKHEAHHHSPEDSPAPTTRRNWFDDEEEGQEPAPVLTTAPIAQKRSAPEEAPSDDEENEEGSGQPMRLQPLHSSALPSIKDLLAIDSQAGKRPSKKRKKGKKGKDGGTSDNDDHSDGGKKMSAEARAERDYKRLKSYTNKKGEAS